MSQAVKEYYPFEQTTRIGPTSSSDYCPLKQNVAPSENIQPVSVDVGPILHRLETIRAALNANTEDVVEEGGLETTGAAFEFAITICKELLWRQAFNPTHDDLEFTPFARHDGGVYILVDFPKTDKRLTFNVKPEGIGAEVAKTGAIGVIPGTYIEAAEHAGRFLGWLTKQG